VYIICLLVLGLPVMTMEFSMGRAAQASPVKMYQKLEKPGQKWHFHGAIALLGNICLMAFYTTVAGWLLYYFVMFLKGDIAALGFTAMITDPGVNMTYMIIMTVSGFTVLSFNLQGGLERISKFMMVALLGLMLVLAVNSCLMPGAAEGLRFYLLPDFSKINAKVVGAAMTQAFFSLSLGMGSMAIFGSYINKGRSLMGESVNVIVLDTFVAIMAGLIIFPACTTYGVEVNAGPRLLFDAMASVFNNMAGGRIWGIVFFLFMVFAAFTTVLAVFENILACVRELTGWSRPKGCAICCIGILALSTTTALGYNVLSGFVPFADGSAWFDVWDFLVSYNIQPLGAIIFAIFCCNRYGWGWDKFMAETNSGSGLKVRQWMKPVFQWIVPLGTLVIYILGLVSFSWK